MRSRPIWSSPVQTLIKTKKYHKSIEHVQWSTFTSYGTIAFISLILADKFVYLNIWCTQSPTMAIFGLTFCPPNPTSHYLNFFFWKCWSSLGGHFFWPPSIVYISINRYTFFTDYNSCWASESSFHVLLQLLCPMTCCGHSYTLPQLSPGPSSNCKTNAIILDTLIYFRRKISRII